MARNLGTFGRKLGLKCATLSGVVAFGTEVGPKTGPMWEHGLGRTPEYIYIYIYVYLCIYIYISIYLVNVAFWEHDHLAMPLFAETLQWPFIHRGRSLILFQSNPKRWAGSGQETRGYGG